MSAARNRKLIAVCMLLTVFMACNRKHDGNDFLPSAPPTQGAVTISVAADAVPADGASTVRITAQISPDADPNKRTVRFNTSLGSWLAPGTAEDKGTEFDQQADAQGVAAAFLKSALEPGVALVTISVITIDSEGFEAILATVSGEVTFTQVQDALTFTATPSSTFADGFSAVDLVATISADAPPGWDEVRFTTDFGVIAGATSPLTITVKADANRVARAQLTSFNVGTATVTATITDFDSVSVTQLVEFSARNPDAVKISASSGSIAADGESQLSIFADIAPGLSNRTVTFTATAGEFVNTTDSDTRTTAVANASNRATVRLQVGTDIVNDVLLTAEITLNDGTTKQSSDTLVDFTRAFPNVIQLSVDPPVITVETSAEITAVLTRDIGDVSEDTPVSFTVARSDPGPAIIDIEFLTNPVLSTVNGDGDQEAVATLTWDGSASLPVVVVITATSGTAQQQTSLSLP